MNLRLGWEGTPTTQEILKSCNISAKIACIPRNIKVAMRLSHLTLHYHNTTHIVHSNTPRVLQHVGSKLSHKLPVLVEDLDLVSRTSLRDHNIT